MAVFIFRLGLVLGFIMMVLGNLAIAASIPTSDISVDNSFDARSAATIPVSCADGQTTIPYDTASSLTHYLCTGLNNQTDPAKHGTPVQPGKMVSQNLITDWPDHVLLSTFVNNTCGFEFTVPVDACTIEFNAIVDQCSPGGNFGNGTTWYGCLRWSMWVYKIV